ncbi:MAG: hypothetical protein A3H64_03040 [Candidatus Ryanbacteria bacterium RIFCSPLOWO2_02_FULL_45_11c]|uniref:Uncharacterized protein n=1 Tax=Candidatus Ryanbacteria bacterium RIFCSPLOWO2_02_FULL_45_11c TaxID=1802128 RepID=A0A1G2H2W4_9BACT|nr:MAG: hypothetical protein A3H64_03040 [Candidatus Ryanbacteria bacterium RIFCSPLOWO2_02_FULL_45_11c]
MKKVSKEALAFKLLNELRPGCYTLEEVYSKFPKDKPKKIVSTLEDLSPLCKVNTEFSFVVRRSPRLF